MTEIEKTENSGAVSLTEIADALESQAQIFETFAAFYYAPLEQEQLDTIAKADFLSVFAGNQNPLVAKGARQVLTYLKTMRQTARRDLNVDFTGAFYGITEFKGKIATPYESVFLSEEGIRNQEQRTQVYHWYKRYGLKIADKFNTSEDHLSFELQFLAYLARKAAAAVRDGQQDEALRLIRDETEFLDKHVLSWFGVFSDTAKTILTTSFYKGILDMTAGFLQLAHESLAASEATLEDIAPANVGEDGEA